MERQGNNSPSGGTALEATEEKENKNKNKNIKKLPTKEPTQ